MPVMNVLVLTGSFDSNPPSPWPMRWWKKILPNIRCTLPHVGMFLFGGSHLISLVLIFFLLVSNTYFHLAKVHIYVHCTSKHILCLNVRGIPSKRENFTFAISYEMRSCVVYKTFLHPFYFLDLPPYVQKYKGRWYMQMPTIRKYRRYSIYGQVFIPSCLFSWYEYYNLQINSKFKGWENNRVPY